MTHQPYGLDHLPKKDRMIKFDCSYCDIKFYVRAAFGTFIDVSVGCSAVHKLERQGTYDIIIKDIVCPQCGCASGLKEPHSSTPIDDKDDSLIVI